MIWRTRLSSLAVSTRPQNETVSSKCSALPQRRLSQPARSSVEHLEEKVQRNLPRQLYATKGQSPEAAFQAAFSDTRRISQASLCYARGIRSLRNSLDDGRVACLDTLK